MTADTVGGVWQYALELAGALRPLGYQVELAVLGPAPSEAQAAAAARAGAAVIDTGLPLDWLAENADDVARAAAAVARLAHERGADVVQLNQPALAAADFAAPVLAVVHSCMAGWWDAVETGPVPPSFEWQVALTASGLARADAVACPSGASADAVQRLYGLRDRPAVIHNGRAPFALDVSDGAGAPIAFTAGRLWDRGKDVATLDAVAARLTIPFRAAGALAGPDGSQVTVTHLEAMGVLDEAGLARQLDGRPIFVSAARYEPFGLAVLEAALAGCALVLSDIPTFRELWDGAASFVAPGDVDGYVAAIAALGDDPARRAAAGASAAARAARFTPAAMAQATAAVHERLLHGQGRAAA